MKFAIIFFLIFSSACADDDDFGFTADDLSDLVNVIYTTAKLEVAKAAWTIDKHLANVTEDHVTFRFFSNKTTDKNGTLVKFKDAESISNKTEFNKDLDSIFIVHGWKNNCTTSSMITEVKQALFEILGNLNIFTVCWDDFSYKFYTTSVAAVPQVGVYLGQFIRNLTANNDYSLSKIKVIGHSLGAHISGFAGKSLNGSLPHIVALDPAAPLYSAIFPAFRLSSDDAQYVEAIHTDGLFLGVAYNVGHVDYYPNGGLMQPGCSDVSTSCAHGRSYYYYAELIRNNTFISRKCPLYMGYMIGFCKLNSQSMMGGYNPEVTGSYYLRTNSTFPYGLGDIGL